MSVCVCGHGREAHRHYRTGTDCALCGDCGRYRPRGKEGRVKRFLLDAALVSAALAAILAAILLTGHIPPGG